MAQNCPQEWTLSCPEHEDCIGLPFQETLANPVHKFRENDAACFLPVKFSIETIPPMNMSIDEMDDYPLVNVNKKLWKITMLLMGKFTMSMAIFNSYVKLPEGKSCMFLLFLSSHIMFKSPSCFASPSIDLPAINPHFRQRKSPRIGSLGLHGQRPRFWGLDPVWGGSVLGLFPTWHGPKNRN